MYHKEQNNEHNASPPPKKLPTERPARVSTREEQVLQAGHATNRMRGEKERPWWEKVQIREQCLHDSRNNKPRTTRRAILFVQCMRARNT